MLFLLTPQPVIAVSFNFVAGFSAVFYATLSFVFVVCLLFSFFDVDCTCFRLKGGWKLVIEELYPLKPQKSFEILNCMDFPRHRFTLFLILILAE